MRKREGKGKVCLKERNIKSKKLRLNRNPQKIEGESKNKYILRIKREKMNGHNKQSGILVG